MRRITTAAFSLGLLALAAAAGAEPRPAGPGRPARPAAPAWREGEAIVRLRPGASPASLAAGPAGSALAASFARELAPLSAPGEGAHLLVRDPGRATAELLASLAADPAVAAAQPNWILTADALPDDPLLPLQWALRNTGQAIHGTAGTAGADVGAEEAWGLAGGAGAVVAVIDSGVDLTHRELAPSLWTNAGEVAGNGLDDDGNGWVDDVHGIDAIDVGDGDPTDLNGHGTHVAGTIAAAAGDGLGVAGLAPGAKVMALRFLRAEGWGSTADAVRCILYAVRMRREAGVNVVAINASWGSPDGAEGDVLSRAVRLAGDAGIVFVAAAGNAGTDNDDPQLLPHFPASYAAPGILSVAATDARDELAPWSNTGLASVDLAAPGVEVLSTLPGGGADGTVFFEDFESGLDGWEHGGAYDLWGLAPGGALGGTTVLEDSPGIRYRPNTLAHVGLDHDLDLSALAGEDVRVSLWARVDLEGFEDGVIFDSLHCVVSGDGGATWVTAPSLRPVTGLRGSWRMYDFAVPAAARTAAFRFRLTLHSDEAYQFDGVAIDELAVGVRRGGSAHGFLSGTSMAAPHAAAAVALLAERFGAESAATRIRRLLSSAKRLPSLAGRVASGGRLDAAAALRDEAPLAPMVTRVTPVRGVAPGAVLTVAGAGFGDAPGTVRFGALADPAWDPARGLRLRFRVRVGGLPDYLPVPADGVHLDDVAVTAGGATLFADDFEGGGANWEHGGERDAWGLTAEDARSPGTSWAESPGAAADPGTHSWLRLAPTLEPGALPARLRLHAKVDLLSPFFEALWPEVSSDGGAVWHPLAALSGQVGVWSRHELDVPAAPVPGEILSWGETEVRVRVPAGAGRHLLLERADGAAAQVGVLLHGWRAEASPREPRSQGAALLAGGKLLSCGGATARRTPTAPISASCEAWDPRAGWRAAASMAQNRSAFVAGEIGGTVYAAGGYGMKWNRTFEEWESGPLRSVEAYDPAADAWRPRALLPAPLTDAAGAALDGRLWVTGGIRDVLAAPLAQVLVYDPAGDRWEPGPPLPAPRRLHAAAAVGGRLCVFGGWGVDERPLTSCLCLDPEAGAWAPIADLPVPLAGQAAAVLDGKVWLAGGQDAARATRELLVYDPATDAWEDAGRSLAEPTSPRAGASLAAVPGVGLVLLGGVANGLLPLGVEVLDRAAAGRTVLLEPAGGETFDAGARVAIRWSAPPAASGVDLAWSPDRGRTWRPIAAGLTGGSHLWRVPWVTRNTGGCLLRVSARSAAGVLGADRSRRAFTIRALELPRPQVQAGAARGGDGEWYWAQLVQVFWGAHVPRPPASAQVELSLDDGASWATLARLAGDPGHLVHTVLGMDADRTACRVRVTLRAAGGARLAGAVSPRFSINFQSPIPARGGAQ